MTTARDVMKSGAQWVSKEQTVANAARIMVRRGVDALVVGDDNDRMCGIVGYRDIVVGCVAEGLPPGRTTVGALCSGTPRWVESNADLTKVLDEMNSHHIKHLPVIEDRQLIGTIGETDLVDHLDAAQLGEFTRAHVKP
ncbi:cyclic nucleotide-binding/CBS domain-containing protein [Nocardia sp. GCM10030253]|uniref:CBS domain-containing protein n=1 Tax=Nocardia sp. GCM10030253 TaxID=3273404 RepID=UPI00363E7BC7